MSVAAYTSPANSGAPPHGDDREPPIPAAFAAYIARTKSSYSLPGTVENDRFLIQNRHSRRARWWANSSDSVRTTHWQPAVRTGKLAQIPPPMLTELIVMRRRFAFLRAVQAAAQRLGRAYALSLGHRQDEQQRFELLRQRVRFLPIEVLWSLRRPSRPPVDNVSGHPKPATEGRVRPSHPRSTWRAQILAPNALSTRA